MMTKANRDDKCLYFIYTFLLFIPPQLLPVVTFDGGVFYTGGIRSEVVGSSVFAPALDDIRNFQCNSEELNHSSLLAV